MLTGVLAGSIIVFEALPKVVGETPYSTLNVPVQDEQFQLRVALVPLTLLAERANGAGHEAGTAGVHVYR